MNAPATTAAITGTTTLTQGDNLRIIVRQLAKSAILLCLIPVVLTLVYYSASGIAPIWSDPGQALFLTFQETWWPALRFVIPFLALMLLICAVWWVRLPSENKIVSYAVDEIGITTSDAAGASLHLPWSMVKRSIRTRNHLIMKMKAGGLRFAPWRAFASADVDRLWDLVQSKTPTQ